MTNLPPKTGIPTMYRGVMFRSRTEARFACLFDELLIPWQYEVLDLRGYIPDFIVHADLLAEIKPDLSEDELAEAKRKIDESGWNGEAVILTPFIEQCAHQPLVGWFAERVNSPDGAQLVWDRCRIMRCLSCGHPSMFPESGSWHCRRCGAREGNAHVGDIGRDFAEAWAEAGNRVQWRPSC